MPSEVCLDNAPISSPPPLQVTEVTLQRSSWKMAWRLDTTAPDLFEPLGLLLPGLTTLSVGFTLQLQQLSQVGVGASVAAWGGEAATVLVVCFLRIVAPSDHPSVVRFPCTFCLPPPSSPVIATSSAS